MVQILSIEVRRSTSERGARRLLLKRRVCRKDLKHPPTAVGGIWTFSRAGTIFKNDP